MASRSWNHIELIGNLTRDPELRYTPQGTAVCTFGVATNRSFISEGERKEETDFHNIVAWGKFAELCSQLLKKGNKVFVSGRLQNRSWETPEGQSRQRSEIVIDDMILLTARNGGQMVAPAEAVPVEPEKVGEESTAEVATEKKAEEEGTAEKKESKKEDRSVPKADETVSDEDLPF